MAAVQGPSIPTNAHKAAGNRQRNYQPMPPSSGQGKADPFYGHESTSRLCARFITHLFACPEYPPTTPGTQTHVRLPNFIAYALHRTKLHPSVTYAALVLLQRLKARFPTAKGSSGHRLFISAFMIASKVICDDTYSNKSWTIVAQGLFTLREINQMEREMCGYLEWELTVDNHILSNFETMVKQDFSAPGPYPTYSLQMVSRRAIKAATTTSATPLPDPYTTTSPIPMFRPTQKAVEQPPPRKSSYPDSPMTPETPEASYSNATSPATTASPQTPVGSEDFNPKIQGYDSPRYSIGKQPPMPTHPLKQKMFAFAMPSSW